VLAVIALAVAQSEQPLLEDRVAPVPQRQREAKQLAAVGDAGESVLAPPVRTVLCVIMGEVVPGVAVGAVVFAHGSPLPLAQIRPPLLPCGSSFAVLLETGQLRAGFVGLSDQHGSPLGSGASLDTSRIGGIQLRYRSDNRTPKPSIQPAAAPFALPLPGSIQSHLTMTGQ